MCVDVTTASRQIIHSHRKDRLFVDIRIFCISHPFLVFVHLILKHVILHISNAAMLREYKLGENCDLSQFFYVLILEGFRMDG